MVIKKQWVQQEDSGKCHYKDKEGSEQIKNSLEILLNLKFYICTVEYLSVWQSSIIKLLIYLKIPVGKRYLN